MRLMTLAQTAALAAALLLTAAPAHADGFVVPSIGSNFSGDTGRQLPQALDDGSLLTYGVAAGFMSAGIFGVEEDFTYTPDFYGSGSAIDSSRVLTLMTNLIVGIPIGGQYGPGFRPYVAGGVGVIGRSIETAAELVDFNEYDPGYDFGGGVIGYFSDHVGLRGDLRYFRNFRDTGDTGLGLEPGTFNFARGTIGVLFRF